LEFAIAKSNDRVLCVAYTKKLDEKQIKLVTIFSILTEHRGDHMNIKVKSFFEFHLKFEEMCSFLLIKIVEVSGTSLSWFSPGK
jgi:DNA-binding ferritin-like protein